MNSMVLGGMVGISLALLNFLASTFVSSKIALLPKLTSIAITLGGFIARLTILTLLFYGLSKVQSVHLPTALVTFVLGFTFFLFVKTLRFLRDIRALKGKLKEI